MKTAIVLAFLAVLILVSQAQGQADWDKSTLTASGACLPGGILRVTVTNGGQDMQGPTAWRFVVGGVVVSDGTLQLLAGASITLDSPPAPGERVEFSADQRPGHPGTGIVFVRMGCSATAVTLSGFSAAGECDLALPWLILTIVGICVLLARGALSR